jgi:hypothetical protein
MLNEVISYVFNESTNRISIENCSDLLFFNRCARLKKENNEIRQQSSSNRSNDQQVELLRQMVRASEDALNKERAKTTTKKTDDYRVLNDQVYFTKFIYLKEIK